MRLDRAVSEFSNNRFLNPMLEPLVDLTQVLARHVMLLPNRLEIGLEHNRRILRALAERDEEAVKMCFGEMMDVSRDYLTKYKDILF